MSDNDCWDFAQGTDEWRLARVGFATASNFADILAKGQGITRAKYLKRVVAERLTGKPTESYQNGDMARGSTHELFARASYEMRKDCFVEEVGSIPHPSVTFVSCSPDGLLCDDGLLEIKSVIPTVQVDTILAGSYPSAHKAQIQGQLWVTGRQWCDFVSYSPDMPEPHNLYVFRVVRDEDYIINLDNEVRAFLLDVETMLTRFKGVK